MNDFVLNIDGYEGPIELLLDLAMKQKVDLKHISILELAKLLCSIFEKSDKIDLKKFKPPSIEYVSSEEYYGDGYEDTITRCPDISKAKKILNWKARLNLNETIEFVVDWYKNLHKYNKNIHEITSKQIIQFMEKKS